MKKKLIPFFLCAFIVVSLLSCSTNFNVAAPYKNITVVYGLLDMADTAHYIRIEKAFLDQSKSALDMAKVPDSNYYPSLNVSMKLVNVSTGIVDSIYTLNRVDLNKEGYQKDSGTFFNSPNYAYKFTQPLNINYYYRLVIHNPVTGETDSADAPVINEDLSQFLVYYFTTPLPQLDFKSTKIGDKFELNGQASPNTKMVQAMLRFHYHEVNTLSPTSVTYKYADWYQQILIVDNQGNFDYQIPNVEFYYFLEDALGPPSSTSIVRHMDSCDIFVYGGTNDLYNYQVITQTTGAGLTANQVKPTYTNMKGQNVLGLFTSRSVVHSTVAIDSITIDSLQFSPITNNLNIKLF